ncbi:MAG: hypothetical protein FJ010_11130 [Chloroflexi bacterium]|nr:hypothetical protein [Chloroflexota bacterium]
MNIPRWQKIGLIFEPGHFDWMATHAQNPLPESLGDGLVRVHFAARDDRNRARGGYFDFHMDNPFAIINISEEPTIDLGPLGAFDDSGVMPSTLVAVGDKKYLYYTGWSKAVTVPFSFHIGLAISEDGGRTYQRYSLAPVLGRNHHDPYITGAPYVLIEYGLFKMWYVSATQWVLDEPGGKPRHYYTVKYAESQDGIQWSTSSHLCLDYQDDEYAIARPVVFKSGDLYTMWFTYRGGSDTYRVGTASSNDGIHWQRGEKLALEVSAQGWDSEMICYAHPLRYKGSVYALYNGNGYGATGIGLALREGADGG